MADEKPKETDPIRLRDRRNRAIALSLGVFVILVFAVTLLKIGGSVAERSF